MSRRVESPSNLRSPDSTYGSPLITLLINQVMRKGKKHKAKKIVSLALAVAAHKLHDQELRILEIAIENIRPLVQLKPKRIGGATYQAPAALSLLSSLQTSARWLVEGAKKRTSKTMILCLSTELIEAYKGAGNAIKKKEEMHKMAEGNKAFG
jgi:small subunit ribosomal protein S7